MTLGFGQWDMFSRWCQGSCKVGTVRSRAYVPTGSSSQCTVTLYLPLWGLTTKPLKATKTSCCCSDCFSPHTQVTFHKSLISSSSKWMYWYHITSLEMTVQHILAHLVTSMSFYHTIYHIRLMARCTKDWWHIGACFLTTENEVLSQMTTPMCNADRAVMCSDTCHGYKMAFSAKFKHAVSEEIAFVQNSAI